MSEERAEPDSHVKRWFAVAALVSLIPGVYLSYLVYRFAVDVPYFDEWGLLGLIRHVREDTLTAKILFSQHEVHRLFFPRIILLGTAEATGWNVRWEMFANVVAGWILLVILGAQIVATARKMGESAYLVVLPVVSSVVFSLTQTENWLWGWQIQIFLGVLSACGALFLLMSTNLAVARCIAAIALGFVATYSFANGLLVWPLGLLPLILVGDFSNHKSRVLVAVWIVASIAIFIAYFYGFKFPARIAEAEADWSRPQNLARYYLVYLGAPFSSMNLNLATVAGAFGLSASIITLGFAAFARRDRIHLWMPGALLILFGLASGVMLTAGRADRGVQQALSSRYITISNVFWIGLVMMIAALLLDRAGKPKTEKPTTQRGFAFLVLALMAGLTLYTDQRGFESMQQFSHLQRVLRYKLLQNDRSPQMLMLYPDVKQVHWFKEITRRNNVWAWRPGAPPEMFEPPPPSYKDL